MIGGAGGLRLVRFGFAVLTVGLALGTHWPGLRIPQPGGITRTDLLVHVSAFGFWTAVLIRCAFFGPALSPRNIAMSAAAAGMYATIDELTQGIPVFRREVAWSDWLMNLAGVLLACALARWLASRRNGARAPIP